MCELHISYKKKLWKTNAVSLKRPKCNKFLSWIVATRWTLVITQTSMLFQASQRMSQEERCISLTECGSHSFPETVMWQEPKQTKRMPFPQQLGHQIHSPFSTLTVHPSKAVCMTAYMFPARGGHNKSSVALCKGTTTLTFTPPAHINCDELNTTRIPT